MVQLQGGLGGPRRFCLISASLLYLLETLDLLKRRSIFRTELDEVIGITGAKRKGRLLVVGNRRKAKPVISMKSIATGEKWFGSLGSRQSASITGAQGCGLVLIDQM